MAKGIWLVLMVVLVAVQGCTAAGLPDIVPAKLADAAQVPGVANARVWGDGDKATIARFLASEMATLKAREAQRSKSGGPQVSDMLALSGGGDDGAFGAGLLVGWSAHGDRPAFDLVTGISSGALIAPFAFLGPSADKELAGLFVKHGGEEIYQANVLAGVLGSSSVADNAPLGRLIDHYVDRRMLSRIAAERAKGRFLLIGTTNLNAQRPVYWDMGRIAQAGTPAALKLFRSLLLASAALPGIFPPVEIEVKADGRLYRETHVDGGPTREVFFTPTEFSFRQLDTALGRQIKRRLWIVRNGKLDPEYSSVPLSAIAIAARSLETLTKNQGIGDLIRMYDKARVDEIDYNLAYIPADFSAPHPAPFDRAYMQALYSRGYELGRAGYAWAKVPPGVGTEAAR